MVEPEMAFFDIQDDMDLAEDMTVYIVQYVLKTCQKELALLERDITKLEAIKGNFPRMSYTDAVAWLQENKIPLIRKEDGKDVEYEFPWGEDFGTPQEEAIMEQFDQPCFIHSYPSEVKAFLYET